MTPCDEPTGSLDQPSGELSFDSDHPAPLVTKGVCQVRVDTSSHIPGAPASKPKRSYNNSEEFVRVGKCLSETAVV